MRLVLQVVFTLLIALSNVTAVIAQKVDSLKQVNITDTLKKDILTAPDTVQHLHAQFKSLIPPMALIIYGAASFYVKPLRTLDRYVYQTADRHNFVPQSHLENYLQYAPVVLTYGVNLVGVHGKNTFIDRTLTYALAQGMLQTMTNTLKHATHRLRPNGADRLSFPSGHTSNAFLNAEYMSQELSGNSVYYGVTGYAFATTTGLFRIYHQDHWLSDVVAGAGLGILSTKAAYLIYPYFRNHLFNAGREKQRHQDDPAFKKKTYRDSMLLPSYQNGAIGLQFSMQL